MDVCAALKREYSFTQLFHDYQRQYEIQNKIRSDICTRFNSKLAIFASILTNKEVLRGMQLRARNEDKIWQSGFHLSDNDFRFVKNVIALL